jgi:filamentous hemagglutinin family protein
MRSLFLALSLLSLGFFASINTVRAQVSSDGTLSTTVSSPDGLNFTIDNGDQAGGNLFHSFSQFSVPTGGSAVFQNPVDVQNIISRVTGGSISNIDGLIRTQGSANLFLLNPAGIFFGPNASLNIGGSFFATTANSFLFGDGLEFSATNLQTPPVLTVNIPIGLRFRNNPGSITNQSIFRNANNNLVGLQVQPGNSLALVGGNINLSDGGLLTATGGSIELGGLATEGTVGLDITGNRFKLNFPTNTLLSDIIISDARVQNVVFSGTTGTAGDVNITTNNLSLINGGIIDASTYGTGNAGRVVINATGNIFVSGEAKNGNRSRIFSQVANPKAEGNSGGIQITTKNLSLINGGIINASTFGEGDAGSIIITADNISVSGETKNGNSSAIFSGVNSTGQRNAGDIQITTKDLSLINGGRISATTFGTGNAGRVVINATGDISIVGENRSGAIFSQVGKDAQGNSGGIQISTKDLSLSDGGQINASTLGTGDAGKVVINATGNIFVSGENKDGYPSGIFSNVELSGVGKSGGIEITTNNLSLTDGGRINASTFGKGDAGSVIINATTGNIFVSGEAKNGNSSGIFSQVLISKEEGNAGGIQINTKDLSLTDGGQINASTNGKGNAGSVIINATGNISAEGENKTSGIFSIVNTNAEGSSGGIQINTKDLSLTNGGQINAGTYGKGNAGRVVINATGNIFISAEAKSSGIFSTVGLNGVGDAGGIQINKTNNLFLNNGGRISTSTYGTGNAGNVIITATGTISASGETKNGNNGGIFSIVGKSRVGKGNAGDIRINTKDLSLTDGGQINASTDGKGNAGSVIITATGNISADGKANDGTNSGIYSVANPSTGNAGGIRINARSLSLSNGAILSANSEGTGTAGNIEVTTAKDIRLDNRASITATTTGDQGNIFLNSRDLILRHNSNITTNATGQATGGNIRIVTGNFVALENSDITANAEKGFGGNIFIKAAYRFSSPDSDITAASELGTDFSGTVQINNTEVNPSQGLVQLPDNLADVSNQIAQNPCQKGTESAFIISGRGGFPSSPSDGFRSNETRIDLVEPVASSSSSQSLTINQPSTQPTAKQITPAQGWIFNDKGEVVLTAYDPTNISTAQRSSKTNATCTAPF